MGHALIWTEGLATALLALALATAWRARGGSARVLWLVVVFLVFFGLAAFAVVAAAQVYTPAGKLLRTSWFFYTLSWLVAFTLIGAVLLRRGWQRPEAGLARSAANWPRRNLWLGFGGAILMFGFTFWNMDLSVRADLAIARQEASAALMTMTPPPVADAENAARLYAKAGADLGEEIDNPWKDATYRGLDRKETVNWKDPYVVELVTKHEDVLALLRKAATMPRCSFDYQRGMLDAARPAGPALRNLGRGITLLAIDARVKAAQGNRTRAFQDITAILGIFRHIAHYPDLAWGRETVAWRTLEEVLRLAPPAKEPLPALEIPDLFPLVRKIREEHALLGMIFPAAASQPPMLVEDIRQHHGSWGVVVMEAAIVPSRVFIVPDEIAAMRKLLEDYYQTPRSAQDETPKDWAELRRTVENDPTGMYGIIFIKPKQRKLLADGSALAALRQTSRTGFAVAKYHHQHGQYPERLEQLVPEFLPAMPVDPRDGQPLRIKRTSEAIVVYAPQNSEVVEGGKLTDMEGRQPPPVFRLSLAPRKTPE